MKNKKQTYTPGPWESKSDTDSIAVQVWADGQFLANVFGESRAVSAANALLIATVPELLDCAKEMLNHFDRAVYKGLYNKWEATIDKAEGRR
jgi:hypothetical protein